MEETETKTVATEEPKAAETTDTQESQEQATPQAGTEQEKQSGYEPFTIPEGFVMDDTQKADVNSFAKEFGLDQAQAGQLCLLPELSPVQYARHRYRRHHR